MWSHLWISLHLFVYFDLHQYVPDLRVKRYVIQKSSLQTARSCRNHTVAICCYPLEMATRKDDWTPKKTSYFWIWAFWLGLGFNHLLFWRYCLLFYELWSSYFVEKTIYCFRISLAILDWWNQIIRKLGWQGMLNVRQRFSDRVVHMIFRWRIKWQIRVQTT